MTRMPYRTTTALVASLSLFLPSVAMVSEARAQEAVLMCLDRSPPPCPEGQPTEGMTLADIEAFEAARAAEQAAAEQAAAEQAAAEQAAAEQAAAEQAAAEQAAAEQAAAEQAAAEQAAAEQAAAEQAAAEQAAAEQAAAEQAAAEQAAAEQAAAEQAAAEQAAAEQAAAEQAAAEQAAAEQAAAEQAAAEQAAAEQAAAEQAAAEQAAAEQAAAEQAAADQAAADQAAAEQAAAEQAAAEQAAAEQTAAEQTAAEQAAAEQAAAEQAAAEQAAAEQAAAEQAAAAEADAALLAEEQAAAEQAAAEQAAAEQAAAEQQVLDDAALVAQESEQADPTIEPEGDAPIEAIIEDGSGEAPVITEEILTEEEVRSSDEEFTTDVDGSIADFANNGDNDDGLSDLEKVLLLGLGAVIVGSILNNGDEVVSNSGDRVVVRTEDGYTVYKDDDALLRQPGSTIRTETFEDGSTRTFLTRPDGTQVVTIRDARGRVLRRARIFPDGSQVQLFDDLTPAVPVDIVTLNLQRPPSQIYSVADADRAALRAALENANAYDAGRAFSLRQIREIEDVRSLVPGIDLDSITFASGSAAIPPEQTRSLVRLGILIEEFVAENPGEVFLIEGHTDATGSESYNLALSDRRAESVALALTENFGIPPENLVVQGYGEAFLKVDTLLSEQANRRATVRRITSLLRQVASE